MADHRHWSRRELLQRGAVAAGALSLPAVLAACGSESGRGATTAAASSSGPQVTSKQVVWANFGGDAQAARTRIWDVPFEREYGARVVSASWDLGKFTAMTRAGRPQWDSIDLDGFMGINLVEQELVQRLPAWVARGDIVDEAWRDYFTGGYAYSVCLGYSTSAFGGERPTGWADFFDTEKFPGKRAVSNSIHSAFAELALLGDGVAPEDVYPLDFDRAFGALDRVRDDLLFYQSYGQAQQLLTQGSVSMAVLPNGRLQPLIDAGEQVATMWEQAILLPWSSMPVPNGAPNADAMFALLDWMARPEGQAAFSKATGYGPTTSAALRLLDRATLAKLPNSPAHAEIAFTTDTETLAEQDTEYVERFTTWVGA